jgi:ABC-type uncharacterized transport system permease subunit
MTFALWLLAALVAIGLGYFVLVCVRADVGSLDEMFRRVPRALLTNIGGTWYNPLAVLEWVFFGVLSLMLLGVALAQASGHAARLRER